MLTMENFVRKVICYIGFNNQHMRGVSFHTLPIEHSVRLDERQVIFQMGLDRQRVQSHKSNPSGQFKMNHEPRADFNKLKIRETEQMKDLTALVWIKMQERDLKLLR